METADKTPQETEATEAQEAPETAPAPSEETKPVLVEPDMEFVRALRKQAGESYKKCFQCATCSATCGISPDKSPFPRKEMAWAVWGLKDRLINDPDVWLCYQCNDCSEKCPRGAKPGDVLAAVRNYSARHYSIPSFMGKIVGEPKFLPVLLAIPAVLILLLQALSGHLGIPQGPIVFAKFFPHSLLDPLFVLTAVCAMFVMAVGVIRFWRDMKNGSAPEPKGEKLGLVASLIAAVREIAFHEKFRECDAGSHRNLSHLLVFYGFVALFITTTLVFFGLYLPKVAVLFGADFPELTPLPMKLYHPVKILANIGAVLFASGLILMVFQRVKNPEKAGVTHYGDVLFLGVLAALVVTGLLTELFRLANVATLAYSLYFIHLVSVFCLIAYLPYSKFAHIAYRTAAIGYSKYTGRT